MHNLFRTVEKFYKLSTINFTLSIILDESGEKIREKIDCQKTEYRARHYLRQVVKASNHSGRTYKPCKNNGENHHQNHPWQRQIVGYKPCRKPYETAQGACVTADFPEDVNRHHDNNRHHR